MNTYRTVVWWIAIPMLLGTATKTRSLRSPSTAQRDLRMKSSTKKSMKMGSAKSATAPQPIPAFPATTPQSTPEPPVASLSDIVICRALNNNPKFYVPSSDPRSADPKETDPIFSSSGITREEANSQVSDVGESMGALGAAADSFGAVFEGFQDFAGKLSLAGNAVALGVSVLGAFGVGGPSTEDLILEAIEEGFANMNARFTDIQLQMRQEFQEVRTLIGNVTLDELSSKLDTVGFALNDYIESSRTDREAEYELAFRTACNDPYTKPRDIFFDLYGYACEDCTYATRKRANIYGIIEESSELSGSKFSNSDGSFFIRGMAQAMFLHTVCLPPVPGACVDRAADPIFQKNLERMENATLEVGRRILQTVEDLDEWVENLEERHIIEAINIQEDTPNQDVSNAVLEYLVSRQPEFHFQVITSLRGDDWHRGHIWFRGCNKDESACRTLRSASGHIYFENVNNHAISIRYRLKNLGVPDNDINGIAYPEYIRGVVARINRGEEPLPGDGECTGSALMPDACNLPLICKEKEECSIDGQNYYVGRVGSGIAVRGATSEGAANALPMFEVEITGRTFRYYY